MSIIVNTPEKVRMADAEKMGSLVVSLVTAVATTDDKEMQSAGKAAFLSVCEVIKNSCADQASPNVREILAFAAASPELEVVRDGDICTLTFKI